MKRTGTVCFYALRLFRRPFLVFTLHILTFESNRLSFLNNDAPALLPFTEYRWNVQLTLYPLRFESLIFIHFTF
jgi:hypothetical protein